AAEGLRHREGQQAAVAQQLALPGRTAAEAVALHRGRRQLPRQLLDLRRAAAEVGGKQTRLEQRLLGHGRQTLYGGHWAASGFHSTTSLASMRFGSSPSLKKASAIF